MDSSCVHDRVAEYNWDDGVAQMWPVADDQRTEFATALLIYWRLGGPWLESEVAPVNTEARRLQSAVRERLLNGFYAQGTLRFDPTQELSRTQLYQFRRAGIPALLLGEQRPA